MSQRVHGDDAASPIWVIETAVFPRTAPGLIAALERRGVPWVRYEDGQATELLVPEHGRAIFWGSLGAAYDQRVAARWRPGAIGDPDRFRCSVYHPHLAALVANADAVFTTAQRLVDEPGTVLAPLGAPARVFVRPDSARKPFAGRTLAVDALSLAALDHGFYYEDAQLPIVVSAAKRVGREWRFVIADGAVVSGCEYDAAREGRGASPPAAARALAERVASADWQAAPLYIVDVGEVDDALRVMELNPFSGADLYDCDADAVITAAMQVAARLADRGAAAT